MNMTKKAEVYDDRHRDILGDAVLCILNHFPDAGRKRIHDLIYLIEERTAKDYHEPCLGLRYNIWARGPVQVDLLVDLTDGPVLHADAIRRNPSFLKDGREFLPVREYEGDGMAAFEDAVRFFGSLSDAALSDAIRGKGILWHREAERLGLFDNFVRRRAVTSGERLDLSHIITDETAAEEYRELYAMSGMGNAR